MVSHSTGAPPISDEMKAQMRTLMTFHYQAINQETVTGKTHFEITRAGQSMVSDGTIQGKWVSDSCGDVK